MKRKNILLLLLLFSIGIGYGQVTTFGDSAPHEFEFLPYSGSRIIQGFRVDMGGKKYCIVYSKPEKGVTPDTLFIQQYIKKGLEWENVLSENRISANTLFIWGKRGGFFTDQDKNGIAYTAFSEEDLASNTPLLVGYFILYKGAVMTIVENKDGQVLKSANYSMLPLEARSKIEEAFGKLDKWKK